MALIHPFAHTLYGVIILRKRDYKYYAVAVLIVAACTLLAIYIGVQIKKAVTATNNTGLSTVLLIDPGHGGIDGGASAADGTVEKDINLEISLSLYDMLCVLGYPARLSRDTDRMLCDSGLSSIRDKKVSDTQNRLEMYNQSKLVVSIHQNHFSQSQYYGAQIFYGTQNARSKMLAASVRETVLGLLQPENKRELKKATKDIYLLSKTTAPAIVVECGFLSNPNELLKLKDAAYRQEMAFAIACGILNSDP